MNSVISRIFSPKDPIFAHRFISSVSITRSQSISDFRNEQNFCSFDLIQSLTCYIKSRQCTTRNTKLIHAHVLKTISLHSDIFVANTLMNCYCKSAAMVEALKVFGTIARPNVISCNIMISGYNQNTLFDSSCRFFCRMHASGLEPNEITYGSILSACASLQATIFVEQVYSLSLKNGYFSNGYVRAGVIDFLAKNCRFDDALRAFHDVWCGNVVCWNAIISGAVKNGENLFALDLFQRMCRGYILPNACTFSSVLTACAALGEVETGKGIQGWAIKRGAGDLFVKTSIVDLYSKCGDIDEAIKEFSRMPTRNVVSWTAIISGFALRKDSASVLKYFKEMREMSQEINSYTITSILSAFTEPESINWTIQVHSWIIKSGFCSDAVVGSALINTYSRTGGVQMAKMVFREMTYLHNTGTYAAMISCFAQNQNSKQAIELFNRMLQEGLRPDKFCTSSVLSTVGCLNLGRQIHSIVLKTGLLFDISVASSLLTMYSKCGKLEDSTKVFEQMPEKDNICWASMISGSVEHGNADQAIRLFRDMLSGSTKPDEMILIAVLSACSTLNSLRLGKEAHGFALRAGFGSEILLGSAVVTMYSKCGALELATRAFVMLPHKNQIACSSLVSGYAQSGYLQEAFGLFHEMLRADMAVDSFTISSVIGAIALLNRSDLGTQLHALVTKVGLDSDASVGSSLMTMYSKCGSIEDCRRTFYQIRNPDLIGWTAMIMSYAQHGKGSEALKVYELMKEQNIKPDSVSFVGVLSACSHCGLIEEGYSHFNSMERKFGIKPNNRHYACMVDLLGRSGRLKEAERFINNMPIEPDPLVWGTLLAACKVYGDIELGKVAASKVIELEPSDAGAYVSLSNICAGVGEWEDVLNLRSLMKGTGVQKQPGWSFV